MVQFRFKLAAVLLLWKNNIADFTINVQEISDPGYLEDCMLVTYNNNDRCKVEHIVKSCRLNNDSDEEVSQNYAMLTGVISLTCPGALFDGICNYLQTINDDEFVK
jgi:hypothetical protein